MRTCTGRPSKVVNAGASALRRIRLFVVLVKCLLQSCVLLAVVIRLSLVGFFFHFFFPAPPSFVLFFFGPLHLSHM